MSGVIFSTLLGCVLYLALMLYSLDQATVIDVALFIKVTSLSTMLIVGHMCCHFSETITTNSFKIGEDAYDLLWNEMTVNQQKAIVLIIARSRIEFRLTGLGLIDCSLRSFLTVTIIFLLCLSTFQYFEWNLIVFIFT